MSRISAFLSVRSGDQFRLIYAAVLLISLPAIFSVGSFTRVRQGLIELSKRSAWIVPGTPTHNRIVSAVKVADKNLPGDRTCLIRSSTAEILLYSYGFTPDHRIGVVKEDDGEISAHSWIELNGDVIIGELNELARFNPLPSLDPSEVG